MSTGFEVVFVIRLQAAVSVPGAGAAGAVLDLDEAHAAFDQPARRQHLHAEVARRGFVEAVELLRRLRLRR